MKSFLLILLSACLLTACDNLKKPVENDPAIDISDAVAIVNGAYISKESLAKLKQEIQQRSPGMKFAQKDLIEELIQRKLLLSESKKFNLADNPEVAKKIRELTNTVLSQSTLHHFLQTHEITDEELKAEYDKQVTNGGGEEFKARHILVKTEDEAKEIIARLDQGGDFVTLAKEKSTGPSAVNGGDLGWFSPQQMVPPFTEAVIALANGKYSQQAVKTDFGWHIVLREDSRAKQPPAFEAIKKQLLPSLQRQKVQEYLSDLRDAAEVDFLVSEQSADDAENNEPLKVLSIEDKKAEETAATETETTK